MSFKVITHYYDLDSSGEDLTYDMSELKTRTTRVGKKYDSETPDSELARFITLQLARRDILVKSFDVEEFTTRKVAVKVKPNGEISIRGSKVDPNAIVATSEEVCFDEQADDEIEQPFNPVAPAKEEPVKRTEVSLGEMLDSFKDTIISYGQHVPSFIGSPDDISVDDHKLERFIIYTPQLPTSPAKTGLASGEKYRVMCRVLKKHMMNSTSAEPILIVRSGNTVVRIPETDAIPYAQGVVNWDHSNAIINKTTSLSGQESGAGVAAPSMGGGGGSSSPYADVPTLR